jgi:hypothetical protein
MTEFSGAIYKQFFAVEIVKAGSNQQEKEGNTY